ncbi:MAG: aminopeptidase [Candidatus Accumulibacter sp.]|uniref:Aminopeptidase n=1 Tax=Candidatus Accumulibacter proximus TaxID=2954385 RepID=A0A935PVN5_9PROT|nr:aminopeptidase [Candidatus Accumulibacter proximus]
MMNRLRDWHLPLLLAALLTGCSHLGYYAQAISGHLEVMRAAIPISDLIVDPASDPRLRQQLAEVQAIRDFASRELGLPDNDSYRAYADLGRPYVVWNVFAAPEFSLHARRWCLLVVGCVSYRGYYDRRDAEQLAAELRQQGYETFVGGVPAYSTLGYFDDPVLNTFLRFGPLDVARTVFHELAHQLVFVAGDTRFNESFATAVENEGLRRWLARHATPEQRAAFAVQRARKAAFMALLRDYGKRFQALYESPRSLSELRVAKAGLLATLRRDYAGLKVVWGGYAGYDAFFGDDPNNATFASLSLYSELVPAFEVLLARQNHDLPQFYRQVASLAALGDEARQDRLQALLAASGQTRQEPSDVAVGVMEDSLRLADRACSGCPQ